MMKIKKLHSDDTKNLKRFLNDGTKKGFTVMVLKSLKRFLNDATKKVLQ